MSTSPVGPITSMSRLNRFIPTSVKDSVRIKLGKASRFEGFAAANRAQKNLHPNAALVDSKAWLQQIFKAFYGEIEPARIIPGNAVAFAQSWVPFQKSGTRIFVYNFFEANYGIRDPILFRAYILDAAQQVRSVKVWILHGSAILNTATPWSELTPEDHLPEEGSLIVQAFHPRIKTPSRQLRFFAFYGPPDQPPTSAVHALALPERDFLMAISLGHRCIGAAEGMSLATVTQPRIDLKPQKSNVALTRYSAAAQPLSNGFLLQKDKTGQITGIWHDGPTPHWVKPSEKPSRTGATAKTALFVPNFQLHAPLLFVTGNQIGFQANQTVLQLFDSAGDKIAEEKIAVPEGDFVIDTREVFTSYLDTKPVSIVLDTERDLGDFAAEPACYVHVYYRNGEGFCDQVHSYHSYGFSNAPQKQFKSYRCRKFAPYFKAPKQDVFLSIHNVGGKGTNKDELVYLRVVTDSGHETRSPLAVPADRVTYFNVDQLLKDMFPGEVGSAVLQLEHPTTNFTGSWYYVNQETGALATDHFTGG